MNARCRDFSRKNFDKAKVKENIDSLLKRHKILIEYANVAKIKCRRLKKT